MLFSSVALKDISSTAINVVPISGSRKRRYSTIMPVVKRYFSSMPQDKADGVRKDFIEGKVNVVVTNLPYSMSLQQADTVIFFSIPKTREALMTGVYQAARSQQQGHVYVLLDKVCIYMCNYRLLFSVHTCIYMHCYRERICTKHLKLENDSALRSP